MRPIIGGLWLLEVPSAVEERARKLAQHAAVAAEPWAMDGAHPTVNDPLPRGQGQVHYYGDSNIGMAKVLCLNHRTHLVEVAA